MFLRRKSRPPPQRAELRDSQFHLFSLDLAMEVCAETIGQLDPAN